MRWERILFSGVLIVGSLIVGSLIGGCGKSQAQVVVPQYTQADRTIEVAKGEQFMLVLGANWDEGYRWVLAKPFDTKVLRLMSVSYWLPLPIEPKRGGQEHWTFRGVNEGKTTLELKYVLPNEPEDNPVTVQFEVTVR
jgi:predicted secreted protein